MAIITTNMVTDEVTYQQEFYRQLYGDNWSDFVTVDRSTDGYTQGILFEHKQNIISYGEAKALGQAIIYLSRFNRDGIPVPRYVCLVSQDEQKVYVYDMEKYMKYIDDIPTHANLKASTDDASFLNGKLEKRYMTINYEFSAKGLRELSDFVEKPAETLPVTITEHNVYGWSCYYYEHANQHKQKAEKKQFFEELRNPTTTLKGCINPWTGVESDFKYIMDMLNDPMTQKKLGAFYTPPAYAKKAVELVKQAIARVPKGNDYVIIDRCAGTGNLEMYLDDENEDILSHVIVSTYELKEWMVLKERFGKRVRYIIPPIPDNPNDLPELNNDGFLRGANALTKEIIENPVIRQYLDNDKCTIILFENPPYAETTSIEFQRRGEGAKATSWKDNYIVTEMKKEISGTTTNDMGNVFIWSAFKYFLRQPTDSYIVFSPVKYWKSQHLINKKFMGGYAFNRRHFHTNIDACIMVAYWSNEEAKITELNIDAIDLDVEYGASKFSASEGICWDEEKCLYDGGCALKCPTEAIKVVTKRGMEVPSRQKDMGEQSFTMCVRCGACANVCPNDALQLDYVDKEIDGEVVSRDRIIFNPSKCDECGECIDACPYDMLHKAYKVNLPIAGFCTLCEQCLAKCTPESLTLK